MVRLFKKTALFYHVQIHTFENFAATTESYKNCMPCFMCHNMASTPAICFLRHWSYMSNQTVNIVNTFISLLHTLELRSMWHIQMWH